MATHNKSRFEREPADPSESDLGDADARMGAVNSSSGRLWDLRRGDADDNRTSPYGRGWRNVVVSTALEFNYLTASIAFVALIIVPALLVGLAPPLLLTYGRQWVNAIVGSYPVAALFWLAVLVGVALWIGRPLLAMAVENLWHLHYTLVFPIFVGLRETISSAIERLPGQISASAVLDRRRRIGTGLAAMLLAGGGLLLAWSVGVLAEPGLTEVVMQPWAVAQAGLSNAAVFLGLSTAAVSLYWFWREIASLRPLRDWSPGPPIGSVDDRTGGAPVRSALGWRALRLSHGMRHTWPPRQPQRPARVPPTQRDPCGRPRSIACSSPATSPTPARGPNG